MHIDPMSLTTVVVGPLDETGNVIRERRRLMNHRNSIRSALALLMLAALVMSSAVGAASLPLPAGEATSSITVRDEKAFELFSIGRIGRALHVQPFKSDRGAVSRVGTESYGYRGAGLNGSFFQPIPLSYRAVDPGSSRTTIISGGEKRDFKYLDAFIAEIPANININGGLVFAGYGISSPKNKYDDYSGHKRKRQDCGDSERPAESLKGSPTDE